VKGDFSIDFGSLIRSFRLSIGNAWNFVPKKGLNYGNVETVTKMANTSVARIVIQRGMRMIQAIRLRGYNMASLVVLVTKWLLAG
jgi:hypothetical protein